MTGIVRRRRSLFVAIVTCTLALLLLKNWTLATKQKPSKSKPHDDIQMSQHDMPKILHQTFKSELAYENYRPLINSCLTHNPNWTYYLWRDADSLSLITDEYPQYLQRYKGYADNLQKSDAIRYIVLHHFGGIYLDMDVECVKPFPPALTSNRAFIDQERVEQTQILWHTEFSAMNSAMGSVPRHPFFRIMADRVLIKKSDGNAFATTGPPVLTGVYNEYRNTENANRWPVRLLPPSVISPLMDTHKNWQARCKRSLNAKPKKTELSWQERGCQMLQSKQWRLDDTDNGTIAVHRFLHLGYNFAAGLRNGTFNVTGAFWPRVKFYESTGKRPI